MGTAKNASEESLQKVLKMSDDQIMSNVPRLSSLVYHYEKIEWGEARQKAAELLRDGKVKEYLKTVRTDPATKRDQPKISEEPQEETEHKKSSPFDDPMYHENYQRLLKLAPGIVERLRKNDFKTEKLYGRSERTGYRDLLIDVVAKEKDEYYLTLSQFNGKLTADPSMILRLDLEEEIVEALEFTDPLTSKRVYSVENRRKFVDPEEQETQNEYLAKWLKKLLDEKHSIKWRERVAQGVESFIIDEYKKKEKDSEPKESKPAKEEKIEDKKQDDKPAKATLSESDRKNLIAAVQLIEGVSRSEAQEVVNGLIEGKNILQYLLSGFGKIWDKQRVDLLVSNYNRLLQLVPDIMPKLINSNVTVRLRSSDNLPIYDFAYGEDKKRNVRKFAVYESNHGSNDGTIIIGVRPTKAYIEHLSGGFFGHHDFYDLDTPPSVGEVEEMGDFFAKWLRFLDNNGYHAEWSEVDETKVIQHPASIEENKEEEDEEHSAHYINEGIPDFELGQVQLVEAHQKHGVTQEMIDLINKTKQGITLRPRKGAMVFNTKNQALDASIQAKAPGLRLSAYGKFYEEGRSNRADRTRNQGL